MVTNFELNHGDSSAPYEVTTVKTRTLGNISTVTSSEFPFYWLSHHILVQENSICHHTETADQSRFIINYSESTPDLL